MSNPMNYLFDGEYRRRPEQNLGGRRVTETRQEVVQRAQQERQRRERERQIATAIVVVQAYSRTYIARKRVKLARRLEFSANRKPTYDVTELGNQLSRLNFFFDPNNDSSSFLELVKASLQNKAAITQLCMADAVWALRIRKLLYNSLAFSNQHAVYIRLFEEFTDDSDISDSSTVRLGHTWLEVVVRAEFFAKWRTHMELKCTPVPFREHQKQPLTPLSLAYLAVLRRPLRLVPRLSNIQNTFWFGKTVLTGKELSTMILHRFTEGFATSVIHPKDVHDPPFSGVGSHLVLPHLNQGDFPFAEWFRFLASTKFTDLGRCRNILYTLLTLSTPASAWANPDEFFLAITSLLHCVDPSENPTQMTYVQAMDVDDDDEDDSISDEDRAYAHYIKESQSIFEALKILNSVPVVDWLNSDIELNWPLVCPIICILARLEKIIHLEEFGFLTVLSFKKDFMCNLYRIVEKSTTWSFENERTFEHLLVFCFLFNRLISTLHDAEFLRAMPMSERQLTQFVVHLKDLFSDIIIHGQDDNKSGLMFAVGEITTATLMLLYDRNTRTAFFHESAFLSSSLRTISPVLSHSLEFANFVHPTNRPQPQLNNADQRLLKILTQFPFCLCFHDRVSAWHRLLDLDRSRYSPHGMREQIQIRRSHIYEDAFEKLSPVNVPDLRDNIRISLVNIVGAQEAGVDGGGLLREFLTETTKAGVDPNRGLFRLDSQNRIYPNPVAKKIDPNYAEHFFLMGRLVGKALYEQTLLELPLAAFFIQTCISGTIDCAVDYLATLDAGLQKNILALKSYDGDWNALGLDFTVTLEEFGAMRTVELKKDGTSISVDSSNVIEYIHLVADYKINKEMEAECKYFRLGLFDVVPILKMFSWREMQTLISGSDKAIDIEDWMKFTHYAGGYTETHQTIELFWQVLRSFDEIHLRKLLKFVTSCSRPPILGFKDLVPNFGIQNAGQTDRLPTAATCMNLLKLPEFTEFNVLRQKLIYAIDAQAGFELS